MVLHFYFVNPIDTRAFHLRYPPECQLVTSLKFISGEKKAGEPFLESVYGVTFLQVK